MAKRRPPVGVAASLGTFAGVFTPSILTILGIILFLRLGFVVGSAGLGRALVILVLANLISVLTSFSLATIATNLRVKGGGDYYLISRTLGVEFGGALGLVLFIAQSISIAFYAIGFGEAVATMLGSSAWAPAHIIAGIAVLVLFALAWVGADAATRFQYGVMTVLGLALVAFFVGGLGSFSFETLRANWGTPSESQPFWLLFAIFFPAVTGFTQGVSMSGDLASPARSLPLGTFLAVGVSIVVYFMVAVVFAGSMPAADLIADYGAMRRLSISPWLVDAGVIAATLSSALASFLGAPRILQSLAQDRVIPLLQGFAVGHGPTNNPRRALLLSLVIALATVGLGNLNLIAPLVSMFFLISYGLLNFATYYEARAQSPSFRPTFRWSSPQVSLAGALACGAVMVAIDPLVGAIAGACLFAILQYLRRTVRVSRWSDSSRSAKLQQIREGLHGLAADHQHARDWRPVIVAFSETSRRRVAMLRFASWVEGGSGFVSVMHIVLGGDSPPPAKQLRDSELELEQDIKTAGVTAFARSIFSYETQSVLPVLLGAHGIGQLRANTVLVNLIEEDSEEMARRRRDFGRQMRLALRSDCNILVLDADPAEIDALDEIPVDRRRIDVWYRPDATGRLCLLLAYLTTRTADWKDAEIRLIAADKGKKGDTSAVEEGLKEMLNEVRIDATPFIVPNADQETLVEVSQETSLVLLPFTLRGGFATGPTGLSLADTGRDLQVVAFAMASQDFDLAAEPEEGQVARVAAAMDRAQEATKLAQAAVKKAEAAEKEAATLRDKSADPATDLDCQEAEKAAQKARQAADRAVAKADAAREEASETAAGQGQDSSST